MMRLSSNTPPQQVFLKDTKQSDSQITSKVRKITDLVEVEKQSHEVKVMITF